MTATSNPNRHDGGQGESRQPVFAPDDAAAPSAHADANLARHRTDEGALRDKVRGPDYAAAPLGTDDEAAGATPQGETRALNRPAEAPEPDLSEPVSQEDHRAATKDLPTYGTWSLIFGALAVLILLGATATWLMA